MGATAINSPAAFATTGITGDSICPHGFNLTTWASDWCYEGSLSFSTRGLINQYSSASVIGGPNWQVKQKIGIYSGIPCGQYFSEGGTLYLATATGSQQNFYYYTEDRVSSGDYFHAYTGPNGVSDVQPGDTSVVASWLGGTTFQTTVKAPNGQQFVDGPGGISGGGGGGCANEAGLFVSTPGNNTLASIAANTQDFSQLQVYLDGASQPVPYPYTDYVRDDTCGPYGYPACTNGAFISSNTGWSENAGAYTS